MVNYVAKGHGHFSSVVVDWQSICQLLGCLNATHVNRTLRCEWALRCPNNSVV